MADALNPVSICRQYVGGPLLTYLVSDQQALSLVHPSLLPKPAQGCRSKWHEGGNLVKTFRMPDGRIRLTISERLVRERDARFQRLMACAIATTTQREAANV